MRTFGNSYAKMKEVFKLTYKMQFIDGDTFYKRLIDGKLTIQTTSE